MNLQINYTNLNWLLREGIITKDGAIKLEKLLVRNSKLLN